ncbi:MAG TPA: glycoside hydrolase family 15 protein [Steroidobacteraceae bacterium]|nr:glycoside hydrolase family 15 protein [Steroidobacteraceae bacterium]
MTPRSASSSRAASRDAARPRAARARQRSGAASRDPARKRPSASYPPLADYALIGDCHTAALVSRAGVIDWCCLPRFDSDSCFGRLLDWDKGGYFAITPIGPHTCTRRYLPDSLILVSTFKSGNSQAEVIDFFAMRIGGRSRPRRKLVRIVRGVRGQMSFDVRIAPRLDFGEVKPWMNSVGKNATFACGSNTGLLIYGDSPLEIEAGHDLRGELRVSAGQRRYLALQFYHPEKSETVRVRHDAAKRLRAQFEETRRWWRQWAAKIPHRDGPGPGIKRSAIILKALTYAPTGAIIASPTTSLPEHIGGERNWDYRFCWIRDSIFTVHALSNLGLESEAAGVRRFIQRSAAGNASELQVLYAVDGKRRLTEVLLDGLEGWRGSRPVRTGNAAEGQFQADMYGMILELSWRWSERGHCPKPYYWRFLVSIIETTLQKWRLPDRGIWEVRSRPMHFVHSKVMCWAALDSGIALARKFSFEAPVERWEQARDELRRHIEAHGVDHRRGIFVRSFGSKDLDAALLLLPAVDFVAYDDPMMLRTTDAIRRELARHDGLIARYSSHDGLRGAEGAFLACTFWLVETLAKQGRVGLARKAFERACRCGNDLGLFSEEYSAAGMLGNFPQGLTHLAHVSAAVALAKVGTPSR